MWNQPQVCVFAATLYMSLTLSYSHTSSMAVKTKQENKRNNQSMSLKFNTPIPFLYAKKDAKHQKSVFVKWHCERKSLKLFTVFPFLINRARSSVGWKMCSIQWNGYLDHDEWALISNCCPTSVNQTRIDSGCSFSVLQLCIVWRSKVIPQCKSVKPDNLNYIECCSKNGTYSVICAGQKVSHLNQNQSNRAAFYKTKAKERHCWTSLRK